MGSLIFGTTSCSSTRTIQKLPRMPFDCCMPSQGRGTCVPTVHRSFSDGTMRAGTRRRNNKSGRCGCYCSCTVGWTRQSADNLYPPRKWPCRCLGCSRVSASFELRRKDLQRTFDFYTNQSGSEYSPFSVSLSLIVLSYSSRNAMGEGLSAWTAS